MLNKDRTCSLRDSKGRGCQGRGCQGRDNKGRALEVLRLPARGNQGWEISGMSSEGMGGEDRANK